MKSFKKDSIYYSKQVQYGFEYAYDMLMSDISMEEDIYKEEILYENLELNTYKDLYLNNLNKQ